MEWENGEEGGKNRWRGEGCEIRTRPGGYTKVVKSYCASPSKTRDGFGAPVTLNRVGHLYSRSRISATTAAPKKMPQFYFSFSFSFFFFSISSPFFFFFFFPFFFSGPKPIGKSFSSAEHEVAWKIQTNHVRSCGFLRWRSLFRCLIPLESSVWFHN